MSAAIAASAATSTTLLITVASIVGVLLVVAGTAGVWFAMRTGNNTQTLANFRDAAASWREKATALESDLSTVHSDLAATRAELAETKALVAELRGKQAVLEELVTGRQALTDLGARLVTIEAEILAEVRRNRDVMSNALVRLREAHGDCGST